VRSLSLDSGVAVDVNIQPAIVLVGSTLTLTHQSRPVSEIVAGVVTVRRGRSSALKAQESIAAMITAQPQCL
jgi:hypothetical protein